MFCWCLQICSCWFSGFSSPWCQWRVSRSWEDVQIQWCRNSSQLLFHSLCNIMGSTSPYLLPILGLVEYKVSNLTHVITCSSWLRLWRLFQWCCHVMWGLKLTHLIFGNFTLKAYAPIVWNFEINSLKFIMSMKYYCFQIAFSEGIFGAVFFNSVLMIKDAYIWTSLNITLFVSIAVYCCSFSNCFFMDILYLLYLWLVLYLPYFLICLPFCMAAMKLSCHWTRTNILLMDLSTTTCLTRFCTAYLFFIFIGGC